MKKLTITLFFVLLLSIVSCAVTKPESSTADKVTPVTEATKNTAEANQAKEESAVVDKKPLKLTPRKVALGKGKSLTLNAPKDFEIVLALDGLKRPRFFAKSPDNRIFLTMMYNRADNSRGAVYILEGFDEKTGRFQKATPYLENLRNPNSIAFYTDEAGKQWLYLALTDKLIRYRYIAGTDAPSSESQVLATFPDYGLNYKYGGWHLTRTIAFTDKGKLYVSVGSSCNSCEETEEIRATIIEMDADGKNQRIFARGMRNAVGLKFANGKLYATNMGSDKLGDDMPEDNLFIVEDGKHYGFPYCYEYKSKVVADTIYNKSAKRIDCKDVPQSFVGFGAHSSPLGLEYFESKATDVRLNQSFLVALHGSSKRPLHRGYRLVRVRQGQALEDFITGFLQGVSVLGRPAGIMQMSNNAFLFTDDHFGRVFYVYKKKKEPNAQPEAPRSN